MFEGHDPYLVALSVVIAILGGYTGFGLAARIRGTPGVSRRVLLSGAAGFLAVGIWTMHFVGMLAAPIPADAAYLVLPTIVSFLICALVVGVSLFFVSIGEPSQRRVISSAVLLGAGIVSMHYVGIHGLAGNFAIRHDGAMVLLSVLIAIAAAYGGLRAFLARQDGIRLTAERDRLRHRGIRHALHRDVRHAFRPALGSRPSPVAGGLAASPQILSVVVAVLCFVIAAGFLLSLVPDPRRQTATAAATTGPVAEAALPVAPPGRGNRRRQLPAADVGPARRSRAAATPGAACRGCRWRAPTARISSTPPMCAASAPTPIIRRIHDGTRERMCPWSISEAEAQLDPGLFVRVHRSHIVAIPHVTFVRKEGDGAVVELDGPTPHRVPVSRAKIAEVKARLGLARRNARSRSACRPMRSRSR